MIRAEPGDTVIHGNGSTKHMIQSSHSNHSEWILLGPLPKQSTLSFVYMRNNDEHIVNICDDSIHKYDLNHNKWSLYQTFPMQFATINSIAVDSTSQTNDFYMNVLDTNIHSKFYHCQPQHDEVKTIAFDCNKEFIEHSIVINGEYHIFQLDNDSQNLQHLMLNKDTQTVQSIHDFDTPLTHFGLVYLKTRQRVLLFGGLVPFGSMTPHCVTDLYSASLGGIDNTQWLKLSTVQLPIALADAMCVVTNDEHYVLILGGSIAIANDTHDEWMDDNDNAVEYKDVNSIYVLDLQTMMIKQSNVDCPKTGVFNAVISEAPHRRKRHRIGAFLRTFYDKHVSRDMIHLIASFYQNEFVHLLDRNGLDKMHWKISVDRIVDSM
eukprot:204655_1